MLKGNGLKEKKAKTQTTTTFVLGSFSSPTRFADRPRGSALGCCYPTAREAAGATKTDV